MKKISDRFRVLIPCLRWYTAIPAAFALLTCAVMLAYFRTPEAEENNKREKERRGQPFEMLEVRGPGTYLRIPHSTDLNPVAGEHYLLVFWFKLKRLPAEGETFTLLRKFDGQLRSQRGVRISIVREGERIRPLIMWRNSLSEGGEYKFSALDLSPKVWTMFALSWNPDQYLGLHVGRKTLEKTEVSLLGGYPLALPVIPDATSDMYIGCFGGTPFRGMFGPVAVVSTRSRKQSLYRIFKEMGEDMGETESLFDSEEVKLLITDASSDRSSYHHTVEVARPSRGEQDPQEEEDTNVSPPATPVPSDGGNAVAPALRTPPLTHDAGSERTGKKQGKTGKTTGVVKQATAGKVRAALDGAEEKKKKEKKKG